MPSNHSFAALWALLGFGVGYWFNLLLERARTAASKQRLLKAVTATRHNDSELMEIIFTNDRTEEDRTNGVSYLDVSNINDFTPRNLSRIIEVINSAERTIDAAVYLFNVKELGKAFIEAHERGVIVRMVGCKSMVGATGTQFPELIRAGVNVMFKANTVMIMHHKFCLVDTREFTPQDLEHKEKFKLKQEATRNQQQKKGQPEKVKPTRKTIKLPTSGVCITGSCNWTMQGFAGNWENIIVTSHQRIIHAFQHEFERIWSDFVEAGKRFEAAQKRRKEVQVKSEFK